MTTCYALLQLAAVQYILDTVIAALAANPDRKFSYAEMVSLCIFLTFCNGHCLLVCAVHTAI